MVAIFIHCDMRYFHQVALNSILDRVLSVFGKLLSLLLWSVYSTYLSNINFRYICWVHRYYMSLTVILKENAQRVSDLDVCVPVFSVSVKSVLTFTDASEEDLGLYTVEKSDEPELSSSYDFTAEGKKKLCRVKTSPRHHLSCLLIRGHLHKYSFQHTLKKFMSIIIVIGDTCKIQAFYIHGNGRFNFHYCCSSLQILNDSKNSAGKSEIHVCTKDLNYYCDRQFDP